MQNNRFKQTLLFMAMLSVAGIALAGSACPDQYPGGVVPVITRPAAWNAGMIELCAPHGGFADGYSPALRVPLYAVEHLTREHVVEHQRNHAGRHDSFRPDDRLSHNQRAELSDFKNPDLIAVTWPLTPTPGTRSPNTTPSYSRTWSPSPGQQPGTARTH